jgi:hypothetical protein
VQVSYSTFAPQRRRLPYLTSPFDLDRRADMELAAGRHAIAEKLSTLAAELRLVGADETDPALAISAIRQAAPCLAWQGFVAPNAHSFEQDRKSMMQPWCVGQFLRAAKWLDQAPRRATVNHQKSTYGWKHTAERWHRERDPEHDYYIGNGMFIAAAYALGLRVARCERGPNAFVNLPMRART